MPVTGVILSVKMDADKKIKIQKRARMKAEKQVARLTDKVDRLKVHIICMSYFVLHLAIRRYYLAGC
jgi:hypothetical protein